MTVTCVTLFPIWLYNYSLSTHNSVTHEIYPPEFDLFFCYSVTAKTFFFKLEVTHRKVYKY